MCVCVFECVYVYRIYTFINPQGEISSLHLTHPLLLRSSGLR